MTSIEKENFNLETTAKSLTLLVRTKMEAVDTTNFNFTADIDEIGQIVLHPVEDFAKFTEVKKLEVLDADVEVDSDPIIELQENKTIKTFNILLGTTILGESETIDVTHYVTEEGKCIICPVNKEESFLTVTMDNSLNLITEDMQIEEYCDGYKLINPGDTWYVKTPKSELIGKGFDTLAKAKIFVCQTEIARLQELSESFDTTNTCDVTEDQLSELTNDFTEEGVIVCSTECEMTACRDILSRHYDNVNTKSKDSKFYIMYHNLENTLTEGLTPSDKDKLIWRMMQGDVDIVDTSVPPAENLVHVSELDTGDYKYYYDEESDVIVSYHSTEEQHD